ncbi:MAG TPA: ATP-binding protein, partial [Thermoanaerobaculia bacterium]|nr:ATP-binding protein [Thermoanaerobaculia bacterium]
ADSKELVVEILDRGRGFSDADLRSAFVPFYTRRRGGTGLGLAIAQKFVRAHGGDITLHNRPDRGAMVRIVLPQTVSRRESAALTA